MAGDGDLQKKVQAGDRLRFPARVYNSLIDLIKKDKRGQGSVSADEIISKVSTSIVLIQNATASNLDRFNVVGLNGTLIDPTTDDLDGFQERIALIGRVPISPDDAGRFAILLEPIAINEIGRAVISGACPVQIDMQNTSDAAADITAGDSSKLTSGGSGATILYKESGTGLKWAVVRVGAANLPKGEFDGMMFGMVSDNETGFSFPRIVNVPPGF